MLRVAISAHRDFDDQRIVQRALITLYRRDKTATIVVGANKADKRVANVWRALGGRVKVIEPEFRKGVEARTVLRDRDKEVLKHPVDYCISFEVQGLSGWMALACEKKNITIEHWDVRNTIVEADPLNKVYGDTAT